MEELRKLEKVQSILSFMKSRGIPTTSGSSSCSDNQNHNQNAHRFLANLILLLIQPCGELDMDTKCKLISENLPKISAPFLEDASHWLDEKGDEDIEYPSLLCCNNANFGSGKNDIESMALIGLQAMERANSTLEDFCRSYFMFHDMDVNKPQSIFRYLPVLSFTESYIYQLDSLNEKLLQLPTSQGPDSDSDTVMETSQGMMKKFIQQLRTDPFEPLAVLLDRHGLLTERMREEFRCGEEYWALERKLCHALTSRNEILIEDVKRAILLKSFDYRVLNLLLYQLQREEVNEVHMEFLSISEFLVEVSDDLFDYEDDVLENNFNVLRMFVRIYGASQAPSMLAKFIAEAEEKYDSLLKALDPKLSTNYQIRCEEATKEGGKISGPSLGTWSVPPIIEDEDLYRSQVL